MTKSPSYKAVYRINNRLSKRDNIDEIIKARIEKEKLLVGRLLELEASLKAKDKLCAFARHLVYIGLYAHVQSVYNLFRNTKKPINQLRSNKVIRNIDKVLIEGEKYENNCSR